MYSCIHTTCSTSVIVGSRSSYTSGLVFATFLVYLQLSLFYVFFGIPEPKIPLKIFYLHKFQSYFFIKLTNIISRFQEAYSSFRYMIIFDGNRLIPLVPLRTLMHYLWYLLRGNFRFICFFFFLNLKKFHSASQL